MKKLNHHGFAHAGLLLVSLIVIGVVGFAGWWVWNEQRGKTEAPAAANTEEEAAKEQKWVYGAKALNDDYAADADVVKIDDDGMYRMYYGQSPEAPTGGHAILSAISSDGKNFIKEGGERRSDGAFPDVVRLKDGRWRMYFQVVGAIKSAISPDGLNFTDEPGARIDAVNSQGLELTQVAAPTTFMRSDGSFVMVYTGSLDKKYDAQSPKNKTQLFLWATSNDGLTFEKQGIALDSRNDTYVGWLDGPDWSEWDDGLRLYYWGYAGIYYVNFDGKKFSDEKLVFKGQFEKEGEGRMFPPKPPGDPSLIKINDIWYMYYGIFDGSKDLVYYATLQ